jgi:hypothetical protein
MKYKTYTVTLEIEVDVKDTGLVVQNPESVASATRHLLRMVIPTGWRKNGLMLHTTTVHAEAKEKGDADVRVGA